MSERIPYIDSIRGFAIFLVVMGHCIAWQFNDWSAPEVMRNPSTLIVWRLIYSFHMPLMMFCSGLLFSTHCSFRKIGTRALTLLLPYFFTGFVLMIVRGDRFIYWFLLTLFIFYVISSIPNIFFSNKKYWRTLETPIYLILAISVYAISVKFRKYQDLPLLDIEHLSLYPYYVFGIISNRHNLVEKYFDNRLVYLLVLLLFPAAFYLSNFGNLSGRIIYVLNAITAFSAIIVVTDIFKSLEPDTRLYRFFIRLGQCSLEIYLLHLFFTVKLPFLGDYFVRLSTMDHAWTGILLPQLFTSLITTVVIISLCFVIMRVLWHSPVISQIFLGRKHETAEK